MFVSPTLRCAYVHDQPLSVEFLKSAPAFLESNCGPAALEVGPLTAGEHYDLKPVGRAVENPQHLLEPPVIGEDQGIVQNDR